ncbi:unnamed protein product [Candidula unifasciata]|uniref:ADP-ribosylhydrolase ARH3 n=1 Tax=Candidula unifasciata TaxID=100452 RepID=A0A8S3YJH4_9EUPU|nr:unnamed protein product [Candidula unifasciata]
MLSRFKACLVGAVVGDCIGSNFEGLLAVKLSDVVNSVLKLEECNQQAQEKEEAGPSPKYFYTDDTAMARSVAASLLDKKHFDARDMADRFATEYFNDPDRGYGGSVVTVFENLKDPDLIDVFRPASMQFGGRGSFGNGGAMRIAPAALFAFHDNDLAKLKVLVSSITRITHTHHLAINGAILQAFAVDQSLRQQQQPVDADEFIDSLISKMKPVEEESSAGKTPADNTREKKDGHPTPYCYKLLKIKELLKNRDLHVEDVVNELGNDVSAFGSVPAAVFSFLKAATQNIPELNGRNKFEQTVLYAIGLGGDTDTIATMAAAIAGALYGMEQIPKAWQIYCEGVEDAERAAEELFKLGSL